MLEFKNFRTFIIEKQADFLYAKGELSGRSSEAKRGHGMLPFQL
jgi:hypothetical protein